MKSTLEALERKYTCILCKNNWVNADFGEIYCDDCCFAIDKIAKKLGSY